MPSVMASVEQAWTVLQPPVPLCSPKEALSFVTAGGGSASTSLSEGSALVAGHTALLLHAATSALSLSSVAEFFCDIVAAEARSHVPLSSGQLPSLPSPDAMLARPLFTPDEANDFAEGVVASFLAASHCWALISREFSAAGGDTPVSAVVAMRLSPLQLGDSPRATAATAIGGPVQGYIDDRDAWLGGDAWHPQRARTGYATAVAHALLCACAAHREVI